MNRVPLLLFFVNLNFAFGDDPLVLLPNGLISGRQDVTIHNNTYYAFEKIPYAASPTGKLRFKAPQSAQNWEGILDTKHLDVLCFQEPSSSHRVDLTTESEDCLFINVFTPKLPNGTDEELLPVMVYIHGGFFMAGSSIFIKSDYILDSSVVLVTMNYRVAIFGFLSAQDEVLTGNYGLKDQLLALRWTHDNIKLFGGDPDKITIFGQSAGAKSVAFQLMNQQSEGLYRGAILQSGSSLMPASYQRDARKYAFGVAALLNNSFSDSDDSQALSDFLLTVEAGVLRAAAFNYRVAHYGPETEQIFQGTIWAPVIESKNPDAFITKKMYGLLTAGNVVKVPIIMGITSEESLGLYPNNKDFLKIYLNAFDEHLNWVVPNDMHLTDELDRTKMGQQIRDMYTHGKNFMDNFGDGIRMYSDNGYTRSVIKFAELYSKLAPTYFYEFSYDGEMGGINGTIYNGTGTVGHAEDIRYLFCLGSLCSVNNYPESDQITSQRMVKMWTNFAKYLNPTPEPLELLQNITWPVVDDNYPYLNINNSLEVRNRPKNETYTKWVELYSSLSDQDFDTY